MAICAGLGYGAWIVLTRPKPRPGQLARKPYTGPDSVGFLAVAAEGVELEVVAPSGKRGSTVPTLPAAEKLAGAQSQVDCPGFASPNVAEQACTASVTVNTPAPGDYTIVARSAAPKSVILSVGWGSASQTKHGGFDVRVNVPKGGAIGFAVIVARDGVSQRSDPRALP